MKYFKEHLDAILFAVIKLMVWLGVFTLSIKIAVNITILMESDPAQSGYDSAFPILYSIFLGTPFASGVSGLYLSVSLYLATLLFILMRFFLSRFTNIKEIASKHQAYSAVAGGVFLNYIAIQVAMPYEWVGLIILILTLSVCVNLYLASSNEVLMRWWGKKAVTFDCRSPIAASILAVMIFLVMPNPGNSHTDIFLENYSQRHEPFNLIATGNLSNNCITNDITHTIHPNPFWVGMAQEPCYLNRYAVEGEVLTESDKRYLLLLDGNYMDYILYAWLYTPGESFDIRLQTYLDGFSAMESQIDKLRSYRELNTPFAVDKANLSGIEKNFEREKLHFKEAERLMGAEGVNGVLELVQNLKDIHTNPDIWPRPELALLAEENEDRDEARVALSLERMKELKQRKANVDAELDRWAR